ncbi:PilZ domain-containing protein [Asticcacaulis sp. BYS171W]|uniref:PilZ domain-containing protein n=1 Tax=Asticcacaulis aquaticus TaxID=2984212 RepID=A0ABT5HRN9_9CAUL|nr:PilZ domain-containing protein [Asticcacaulis aquaticus]MDC7682735.1 PilZ domain-containing protein [Asticcacaulis aquaticus]
MTAPAGREASPAARPISPVSSPVAGVSSPRPGVEIIQPYAQFTNRRSEPRFDCNETATLFLFPSQAQVECRILNQSASGAQVIFESLPEVPAEIWLIDIRTHTVKCGTAAWSMTSKMGLKFSFLQRLDPNAVRPARVPEAVFKAWRKLAGLDPEPPVEDDVFFLD